MSHRIILAAFAWGALALGVVLNAQDSGAPKTGPDAAQIKENLGLKEQILARQYLEFEQQVLRLKQRLERSSKQEERDQALVLSRVLEYCKEKSISVQFEQMVDVLKSKELKSLPDIKQALTRSTNIAEELRYVIEMLREDSRAKTLRNESKEVKDIIEALEKVIQQQQIVRGMTDRNKTESNELKKIQAKVTEQTAKIAEKLAGKDGADGKKNSKGDPKALGKNGEKAGEAKGDNEKSPSAQAKDGGGDDKEPKGGAKSGDGPEGKDGKGKDGGEGQAKDGKGKDGGKDGGEGQAKDGKGKDGGKDGGEGQAKGGKDGKDGENKDGKGSEGAQAKDGGKSGENPKGGDPKAGGKEGGKGGDPAQAKDGGEKKGGAEGKGGDGKAKDGKGGEAQAKGGDGKGGEGKDGKGGEGKGGEGKSGKGGKGEAKAGESSKGQSQAKSNGEQSPEGPQGPQGPQGQAKDSGKKKNGPQAGPQDSNAKVGKKQVEEGYEKQQDAEAKIEEKKNDDASADQGKAIDKLEQAKKELEKLLRQLREEELERILAALQARCEKMLAMQKQVLAGTETVAKAVDANADKQPNRENKQDSLKLSDNEGDIVVEATKAIDILEAEGSAIAFPEVFQQVREDMKHVQRRLGVSDSGKLTQEIERDIIASLGEMIDALKKARKDNADSKSGESKPGQPPPAQDQKLLEQIAELKMIRSLQIRVNTRTQTYGKLYQGEQSADPNITRELRNLSERQERIFEITNRMAKGDNR